MGRPYTGWDGDAKGKRAGTEKFVQLVCFLSGNKLWNNGTWLVRNARGKDKPSVHGTGRAADLSWRLQKDRNRGGSYADAQQMMDFLVQHADLFRIELITDYYTGYGRTWKSDRGTWKVYDKPTVSGAPGGDWIHVEISNEFCDDPAYYDNAVKRLFSNTATPSAPAPAPAPKPVVEAPKPKPATAEPKIKFPYPGKPIKWRSKGDDVKLVQAFLKIAVTGTADKITTEAVKDYQSAHGLKADGVVGPATWQAMFG